MSNCLFIVKYGGWVYYYLNITLWYKCIKADFQRTVWSWLHESTTSSTVGVGCYSWGCEAKGEWNERKTGKGRLTICWPRLRVHAAFLHLQCANRPFWPHIEIYYFRTDKHSCWVQEIKRLFSVNLSLSLCCWISWTLLDIVFFLS